MRLPSKDDATLDRSASTLEVELGHLFSGHLRLLMAGSPGVNLIGVAILRLLAERGDARGSDLAGEFAVTQTSISRHVATLVSEGLVEQRPDARDGRAVRLGLTEAGRRALAAEDARRRAIFADFTADWSEDERRLFLVLLARLNARGKEYVEHRRSRAAGGGVQ